MTESGSESSKRSLVLAAGLFAAFAAALYLWAIAEPDMPPPAPPDASTARRADAASPTAAAAAAKRNPPATASRPAPVPPRPALRGPEDEDDEEEPPEPEPVETVTLTGRIVDTDGNAIPAGHVFVRGPGYNQSRRADGSGGFTIAGVPAHSTVAWGERRDGALSVRGPTIAVTGDEGDELEVELVVPAEVTGGIGAQLQPTPDGARILRVLPGGQAEHLGLKKGDVILEFDGEDLGGMDIADIAARIKGPEGTGGTLRLRRAAGGEEVEVAFEREFVDPPARRRRRR